MKAKSIDRLFNIGLEFPTNSSVHTINTDNDCPLKMLGVFFFFKQKTAYEIRLSLVGSEMCIRDRTTSVS